MEEDSRTRIVASDIQLLTAGGPVFVSQRRRFWTRTKPFEIPFDRFRPIEDGTVLYRLPYLSTESRHTKMKVEHDLTFEIAFGEGEVLEGEAVLPTLHRLAERVDRVAKLFIAAQLLD